MFVNPISNYILIVRSSWSSVISGRLSWAASNKFVGTVECRPHRQSRAAVWPINISHYAAATMMVIKEEKNWSPILDLDMMKHVVSSTWLTLTRRLLTFLVWQSSFNSEKQFSWHLFVLQKSCVIYLRQFQAIFTKSKIKPCITFDPAKKPNSARNRTVHILFDKIFLSLTNPELGVVQMVIYLSVGLGFYWMFYGLFNSFLILFIIYLYQFQLFNQNKVNKLEINFNWPRVGQSGVMTLSGQFPCQLGPGGGGEGEGRQEGRELLHQAGEIHRHSHTVITFLSRISLINYCSSPVSSHGSNWLLFLISSRVLALPSYLCRTFDRQSGLANMIFK